LNFFSETRYKIGKTRAGNVGNLAQTERMRFNTVRKRKNLVFFTMYDLKKIIERTRNDMAGMSA